MLPSSKDCIGHIGSDRLGLQVAGIERCLRSQALGVPPGAELSRLLIARAANRQYIDMARRRIGVVESRWLSRLLPMVSRLAPRACPYRVIEPDLWSYGVFARGEPSLAFTSEEHERGRTQLASLGLGPRDWFVCFYVRDEAAPGGGGTAYKRAELESYRRAVQLVVARGGFAIRMGAGVAAPLPDWGPRIVDYAWRSRSDFMDVYLCAHARFFLGSSAGLAYLAVAFNVPVATANLAPLGNPPQSARDRFIPKLLYRAGRPLAFDEIHELGLWQADGARVRELGLQFRDNEPDDICDLCRDMLDDEPAEAAPLQRRYRDRYFFAHPQSADAPLIGASYALKYRALLPGV